MLLEPSFKLRVLLGFGHLPVLDFLIPLLFDIQHAKQLLVLALVCKDPLFECLYDASTTDERYNGSVHAGQFNYVVSQMVKKKSE